MYYFVLFTMSMNVRAVSDFRFFATVACSGPSCELKKWSANGNIEHTCNWNHCEYIKKERIRFHAPASFLQFHEYLLFSAKTAIFCGIAPKVAVFFRRVYLHASLLVFGLPYHFYIARMICKTTIVVSPIGGRF